MAHTEPETRPMTLKECVRLSHPWTWEYGDVATQENRIHVVHMPRLYTKVWKRDGKEADAVARVREEGRRFLPLPAAVDAKWRARALDLGDSSLLLWRDGRLVYLRAQYLSCRASSSGVDARAQVVLWATGEASLLRVRVGVEGVCEDVVERVTTGATSDAAFERARRGEPLPLRVRFWSGLRARLAEVLETPRAAPRRALRGSSASALLVSSEIWDLRRLRDSRVVVLDTETTGLVPGRDCVVQLAACRRDGDGWSALLRVDVPMSAGAQGVHGIDDARVRAAPPPSEALTRLVDEICEAGVMVAYNAAFDVAALLYTMRVYTPALLDRLDGVRVFDVFSHIWVPVTDNAAVPFSALERTAPKLERAHELACPNQPFPGEAHDALADTRAARDVMVAYEEGRACGLHFEYPPRLVHLRPWLESLRRLDRRERAVAKREADDGGGKAQKKRKVD